MASSKSNEVKKDSFFDKMKNDKKYSAKVQLIGYGIFIVILVLGLNISSMGSGKSNGSLENVIGNGSLNEGLEDENTSMDDESLLKMLDDNYSYDVLVSVIKRSMNALTNEEVDVESKIKYSGKSYGKTKEISRSIDNDTNLYYRVDDNYYSMLDNITSLVKENQVYDIIDRRYIEIDSIMELIEKASLDHVTEFSNGRRELVYHLPLKDAFVSHHSNISIDKVIEISAIEENQVLTISIDYSSIYDYLDESIVSCKVEAVIKDIGKIEEFEVIVSKSDIDDDSVKQDSLEDENTSIE